MKIKISLALLIALAPALEPTAAFARPKEPTAHMRPQLYHDHSPHARVRDSNGRHSS
ncbi:hypothetical protein [Granulicella sp. L60]|uniref:hypothetical protein n=1 Tax=Granulicella sp. L60 TaxID=1641866 RepID=UPI00131B9196|nr:hypothetical protein [Granulicella sp. L60]